MGFFRRKLTPAKTWKAARDAGGSILGPGGQNWTGPSNGGPGFENSLNDLCGKGTPAQLEALTDIQNAADTAAKFAEMNAIGTTSPKCHSKPLIKIDAQCQVTVEWHPRSREEEDCGMG